MPMMQAAVRRLNRQFDDDHIANFAKGWEAFAPGQPLDAGLLLEAGPLRDNFQGYLDRLPGGMREMLRGLIHYALSASPPVPITFAWAPGYEFELSVWQPACGVTVLLKGRYPGDPDAPGATGETTQA